MDGNGTLEEDFDAVKVFCGTSSLQACSSTSAVHDLVSCLYHHNRRCHQTESYLTTENENSIVRQIELEVLLGILFLVLPTILATWVGYKMVNLLDESTKHMNLYLNDRDERSEWHQPPPIDLSFLKISFFVKINSSTQYSYLQSSQTRRVLDQITGSFRAHQVSAIMGPSGSGKTTLLKLIGGRMYSGEFFGIRSVNSEVLPSPIYDSQMRSQGFVSQHDVLLPQLTIWETIMFAALLRMPLKCELQEKLKRARAILSEMGLFNVRNNVVGTPNSSQKSISGGQRRRLSIAQELIGSPSAIFLDEPTSGLDASNSLRIIQLLHLISRSRGISVILTIHQPRSEAFELFDTLVLLGQGGRMVYSGICRNAQSLMLSCPSLPPDSIRCDNPGDFIIDVLGLENDDETNDDSVSFNSPEIPESSTHSSGELDGFITPQRKATPDLSLELSTHFMQSTEYIILLKRIEESIEILRPPLDLEFRDFGVRAHDPIHKTPLQEQIEEEPGDDYDNLDFDDERGSKLISMMSLPPEDRLVREFREKSDNIDKRTYRSESLFFLPFILSDIDAGRSSKWTGNWIEVRIHQLWVLFARRVTMLKPHLVDFFWNISQMILITLIIAIAFSYKIESEIEEPYQIFMLIFTLSSYAMILQYLTLVPEYYMERKVTFFECSSGISSYGPYILAVALTEFPRAILQCILLYGVLYMIHPLNPSSLHIIFSFLCLIVGVCAWQSVLCICSVISDKISVAYTLAFLIIGSGTLFGGLLVSLPNIPTLFRYVYYFSVTAVTQRALLVNDMDCCYLQVTCDTFESDFLETKQTFFSRMNNTTPISLCNDVSEKGNLGRYTLEVGSLFQPLDKCLAPLIRQHFSNGFPSVFDVVKHSLSWDCHFDIDHQGAPPVSPPSCRRRVSDEK